MQTFFDSNFKPSNDSFIKTQTIRSQDSPGALSFKELKQKDEDKQLGSLTFEQLGLTEEKFYSIKPEDLGMKSQDFNMLTPQQRIIKISRQILKEGMRKELGFTSEIKQQIDNKRKENQIIHSEKLLSLKAEREEFLRNFPDTFENLLLSFNEVLDMDVPSERISMPSLVKDAYRRVDAKRAEIIGLLLRAEELDLLKPKSVLEMLAGGTTKETPLTQLLADLKGKDVCHNALATDGLRLVKKIKVNLGA